MSASFGDLHTLLHSALVVLNETVTAPTLSAVVFRDSKAFASEVKLERFDKHLRYALLPQN